MFHKINLYGLIFLLLSIFLTAGCGGSRRGVFAELGGGIAAVAANEEWTRSTYEEGFLSTEAIETVHHNDSVIAAGLASNVKFGYGFSDQFLISLSGLQSGNLSVGGIGLTYFTKKTAPSTFYDLNLPISVYTPEYRSDQLNRELQGTGISIGVGYEFKKHWIVRADLSAQSYYEKEIDDTGPLELLVVFGHPIIRTIYRDIEATGYSFGLRISYLFY